MEQNKRIEWIDIAKGFSIILVVIGHSGFDGIISDWMRAFRMPFFFFVSGILFNYKKFASVWDFIDRRKETIIRPYIIFSIIVVIWAKLIDFNETEMNHCVIYKGFISYPLWFIPVLMQSQIVFYQTCKLFHHKRAITIVLFLYSLMGLVFSSYNIHIWYKVEVVFTAVFFYGLGNLLGRPTIEIIEKQPKHILAIFSLVMLCSSVCISTLNTHILDLCFNIIGEYIPAYSAALTGTIFMILFSKFVSIYKIMKPVCNFVSYIGKNSYVVLAFHSIIGVSLIYLFDGKFSPMTSTFVRYSIMWTFLFAIIFMFNNYCPWILGKKKQ